MSVRPITESEERQAYGTPVTNWLMLFGASQGFLHHLRFNGLNVHSPMMATPMARMTFPAFVLGGAAAGTAFGIYFFGDEGLRRLSASHMQDKVHLIES